MDNVSKVGTVGAFEDLASTSTAYNGHGVWQRVNFSNLLTYKKSRQRQARSSNIWL